MVHELMSLRGLHGVHATERHAARRDMFARARSGTAPPPVQLACDSSYSAGGFRTCCSHGPRGHTQQQCSSPQYSPCSGTARSADAILFVVQKKHATYDAILRGLQCKSSCGTSTSFDLMKQMQARSRAHLRVGGGTGSTTSALQPPPCLLGS